MMAASGCRSSRATSGARTRFPRVSGTTSWSGSIPASAISRLGTSPRGPPRKRATRGSASVPSGLGVYLDFADVDQTAGRADDPGAIRQSLRDVSAHHRRESVRGADADLPRRALHDGRALGRLQPDEHDTRPPCHRGSQLFRPWRQPARRQRPDAGLGRRLLRPAGHDRRLSRVLETGPDRCLASRRAASRSRRVGITHAAPRHQGQAYRGFVPPRAGQDHVGLLRHGAQRGRASEGARADPRLRAEFWRT